MEDEDIIAMVAQAYLKELGCEVVGVAARFEDALEKARSLPLDAALLDMNLAGRMTFPVAEVLRDRGLKVLFATGYGGSAIPTNLRDFPVLAKPYGLEELASALEALRAA